MSTNRNSAVNEAGKSGNTDRRIATLVGIFFIIASSTAILGMLFYQPVLKGPDYLTNGAAHANQVILGALMELTLAVYSHRYRDWTVSGPETVRRKDRTYPSLFQVF